MKKSSASLAVREMQIKNMLILHLTPARMAIIKNLKHNKCSWGHEVTGTLEHCWGHCRLVEILWEVVCGVLKKKKNLGIKLPGETFIPLCVIFPKETKLAHDSNTVTSM